MFTLSTLIPDGSHPVTEKDTDAEFGMSIALSWDLVLRAGGWKIEREPECDGDGDGRWGGGVGVCDLCGPEGDGSRRSESAAEAEAEVEDLVFLVFFFFFFGLAVTPGSWYEVEGS